MCVCVCVCVCVCGVWHVTQFYFSIHRLFSKKSASNNVHTYPQLCQRAFGPNGRRAVTFFMASFAYGAMIVYTTMIGEVLPTVGAGE